jgi:hypothetical protein
MVKLDLYSLRQQPNLVVSRVKYHAVFQNYYSAHRDEADCMVFDLHKRLFIFYWLDVSPRLCSSLFSIIYRLVRSTAIHKVDLLAPG